jgi:hypothetical protein
MNDRKHVADITREAQINDAFAMRTGSPHVPEG